jgi:hypothetical protein
MTAVARDYHFVTLTFHEQSDVLFDVDIRCFVEVECSEVSNHFRVAVVEHHVPSGHEIVTTATERILLIISKIACSYSDYAAFANFTDLITGIKIIIIVETYPLYSR